MSQSTPECVGLTLKESIVVNESRISLVVNAIHVPSILLTMSLVVRKVFATMAAWEVDVEHDTTQTKTLMLSVMQLELTPAISRKKLSKLVLLF